MTRRTWVRLDNASNIFLAARSDVDPKVFRISAEVDHPVEADLLQDTLDETYDRYPLYHAVMRSGIFWSYMQDSDLRPVVAPETQHTCAPIYREDRRTLLFRVVHHRRRITLEIFHALSDGTGALWFLSDLLVAYTRRRASRETGDAGSPPRGCRSPERRSPERRESEQREPEQRESEQGLVVDSFAHYFRARPRESGSGDGPSDRQRPPGGGLFRWRARDRQTRRRPRAKVYRVPGTRTPDNRTRAVELTMSTADVLSLARQHEVSVTMFLTALFFESIRLSAQAASPAGLGGRRTVAASLPVNLRQFFPSTSARNFFATVRVAHTYGEGDDDIETVSRELQRQFTPQVAPEALERKLRRFVRVERQPLSRVVPRVLKDRILSLINRANNRGLTVAASNLGRVSLPDLAEGEVRRMLFHVSAVRPQFCAISHGDILTVSFTSPFTETDHIREFARLLTGRGVAVRVASARVTEEEIREAVE